MRNSFLLQRGISDSKGFLSFFCDSNPAVASTTGMICLDLYAQAEYKLLVCKPSPDPVQQAVKVSGEVQLMRSDSNATIRYTTLQLHGSPPYNTLCRVTPHFSHSIIFVFRQHSTTCHRQLCQYFENIQMFIVFCTPTLHFTCTPVIYKYAYMILYDIYVV